MLFTAFSGWSPLSLIYLVMPFLKSYSTRSVMVLQMYAKFGNLKDLDFFLIFIDEMFGGNRSILWENDFEGLMMFYSILHLSA